MNLDEQLRAALNLEADRQTPPVPDTQRMIIGGQARQRRRTRTRVGLAAAAVLLVAGGAYGVMQFDLGDGGNASRIAGQPSPSESSTVTRPPDLAEEAGPTLDGRYRLLVGADASGSVLKAEVTLGPAWEAGNFPTLADPSDKAFGGVAAFRPLGLGDGSGCRMQTSERVGQTAAAVAADLAALPRSTVLQPVRSTTAFGQDALHLRLRIGADCLPNAYLVAETARGSLGISHSAYGTRPQDVIMDFWVTDVGGVPVVVAEWHNVNASAELVDSTTRARESITFVTLG